MKIPGATLERPVLVDEADGKCEICDAHEMTKCDACGKKIPVYLNMGGSGYQSPKPSHYHIGVVGGVQGRRCKWSELCLECYKKEYLSNYGKEFGVDTPK